MTPRTISLIICSRGRPGSLARTLAGVAWLRHPAFEVIVVADPADRETAGCIARLAPGARVGECAPANLAMARNVGLRMARGEVVAFLDDDAVPEPDWLDLLARAYDDPGVSAAGGFIRARDGVSFQCRVVLIDEFGGDHRAARVPRRQAPRRQAPRRLAPGWFVALTGTNFSVRRAAALAIGGFDENYAYYLEETDFLRRLTASGGRIVVVPAAEIQHFQAAGALRDAAGVPASFEVIARSKAYYCAINRRPETSSAAIAKALAAFSRQKMRRVKAYRRARRISGAQAAELQAGLEAGLRDGQALALSGRNLPRFEPDDGVFAAFGVPARRRVCVLANAAPSDKSWLAEIGGADAQVTVIGLGDGLRSRVDFEASGWRHEIGLIARIRHGGTARAVLAELRRVAARRRFDGVYIATESPALARAAAASGLPRFNPGTMPEPR